jgi:hypothetical protein
MKTDALAVAKEVKTQCDLIQQIDVKTCVRVATDFGTGTVQNIQRWPRIGRQAGESYWYRTYGIKLEAEHGNKFRGLTNGIGYMHRDEFFILDVQYRPITPKNVALHFIP